MNTIGTWALATGLATAMLVHPQKSAAEGFTGEQFLEWDLASQDSYFQTSITMASIMATKLKQTSGDCIAAWYLEPDADRAARNTELRDVIARNHTYHPSAVVFLVLEQTCGPFS